MILSSRLALLGLLALGGACSHVLSPPAHVISLESAAPVKPGETVVGARGGGFGAIFGSGVGVLGGNVRHGVAPDLELNAEATYGRIDPADADVADRNAFAGRLGGKLGSDKAALTSGVGGGYVGATGGFVAVDTGFIVAGPNCYVVPFLSPSGFVSAPTSPKTVTFTNGGTSRPGITAGFGLSAGIEIQLKPSSCHEGHTSPHLQLGASFFGTKSYDTASDASGPSLERPSGQTGAGFGVGLEFPI